MACSKLYDENQFPHLDVGCVLRYNFRGAASTGDDIPSYEVTLGAFCYIGEYLYALCYPPGTLPPCNDSRCIQVHLTESRQTRQGPNRQTIFQLNKTGDLWTTANIAAIKLRDQETADNRRQLKEKMGRRLFSKIIDISHGDEASRVGIQVFEGNLAGLVRSVKVDVQSTQQGMRYGQVRGYDADRKCLIVDPNGGSALVNGVSRGALVTACQANRDNDKYYAYGIIIDSTADRGVAVVYSLNEALTELKRKHFPRQQITLCCP